MHASPHEKILGLFESSHFPYVIDYKDQLQRTIPSLGEMTALALHSLAANSPEGFLLQIEGARVDHAAHNNDPAALLWEQLAFDEAIEVVWQFTQEHPDTLVIVTSDHSTGNPGLNGLSASYDGSSQAFARLTQFKSSFAALRVELANQPRLNATDLLQIIFEATSLQITPADARLLLLASGLLPAQHPEPHQLSMIEALAAVTRNVTGIGWSGTTHTSDLVPILAIGPERDRYQGLLRNSDNFSRLAPLLGITHRNPSFTEAEAEPYFAPLGKPVGNYA
jgi:alkaline phosphatase